MTTEPIPYDEMTDGQRKAIVEAAVEWCTKKPTGRLADALDGAVSAAFREKPKRAVFEWRNPRAGELYGNSGLEDEYSPDRPLISAGFNYNIPRWVLVKELDS